MHRFLRLSLPSLVSAVAPLFGACGGGPAPAWTSLAGEAAVAYAPAGEPGVFDGGPGRPVRLVLEEAGPWLETVVERGDWQHDAASDTWQARVFLRARSRTKGGLEGIELRAADGRRFPYQPRSAIRADGMDGFPVGAFHLSSPPFEKELPGTLMLRLAGGEEPPATATLRVAGGGPSPAGRLAGHRFSGDGIAVWPGLAARVVLDLPARACLRFATTLEPALAWRHETPAPTTFRVRLDGETVFEERVDDSDALYAAWHAIELPPAGRTGAELRFEVEGPLPYAAFQAPVIGPRDVGRPGDRPWHAGRPDVVVFLADTFRADNMAAYGGEPGLTPYLDRLASESLLFRRAWSVGTFTLPAHVALFSGLYARQAGAVATGQALPDDVVTVAELFREHGYRTGAITDSVIVSQKNNLDQGFEWFDESFSTMESTLARVSAFLDADDGRPLFLFVQSYRTHTPYVVSDRTYRELGRRLGLKEGFNKVSRRIQALGHELGVEGNLSDLHKSNKRIQEALYSADPPDPERIARFEGLVGELRALYRATAADLDRGFEAFHRDLAARGILDGAYLVFLSDHGEGFGEHKKLFHGGKVWEEITRIPLFLRGPGIEHGVVDHAASMIDLAPTLCAMAGIERSGWQGRSLLALDRDRPVFTFENQRHERSTLAIIEGEHKLIAFEDPERIEQGDLDAAYDLGRDPGETRDLAGSGAAWPRALLGRLGEEAKTLLVPLFGEQAADLDAEREDLLRDLGYGGEQ